MEAREEGGNTQGEEDSVARLFLRCISLVLRWSTQCYVLDCGQGKRRNCIQEVCKGCTFPSATRYPSSGEEELSDETPVKKEPHGVENQCVVPLLWCCCRCFFRLRATRLFLCMLVFATLVLIYGYIIIINDFIEHSK